MNIVITGGTGFIGSNLCKKLLLEGNKITCIDNNFTGSLENIKECLENPNFSFINHNVIEPIKLENISKIDQIYHLACPASPKAYQSDPLFTLKTNIFGTRSDVSVQSGNRLWLVARLLAFSAVSVRLAASPNQRLLIFLRTQGVIRRPQYALK